jgi:hypothetical protein
MPGRLEDCVRRARSFSSLAVLGIVVAACGGRALAPTGQRPATPTHGPSDTAESTAAVEAGVDDEDVTVVLDLETVLAAEEPSLTPPDRLQVERARAAARDGDLYETKRILGRVAVGYPRSRVLVAQYNAVCAQIETLRAGAKASLEAMTLRSLEAPPAVYTLIRPAKSTEEKMPRLVKSSDTRNQITDDERWFAKHGLHGPRYFVPPPTDMLFAPGTISTTTVANLAGFVHTDYEPHPMFVQGSLPLALPLSYGTIPLTDAIDSAPYLVAVYGRRIIAVFDASARVVGLFDFESFVLPPANRPTDVVVGEATVTTPEGRFTTDVTARANTVVHEIMFALARDGVLYVQHGNLHYAKVNRGQNAYITAIELSSGDLLWRSAPLVANGRSFALVGAGVVCGYGFTAERDFLYVLDRATGRERQKIPLRKAPMYIQPKADSVFVRTYDRDLVFAVR